MDKMYYILIAIVVIAVVGVVVWKYTQKSKKAAQTGGNEGKTAKRRNPSTKKLYLDKQSWINEKVAWLKEQKQKDANAWQIRTQATENGVTYEEQAIKSATAFINDNWDKWEIVYV